MYNTLYKFNIEKLLKIRLHLCHKEQSLNKFMTSYLYGLRHHIAIYNLDKLWLYYKYMFYNLVKFFSKRCIFFIVSTNSKISLDLFLENLLKRHSFIIQQKQKKVLWTRLDRISREYDISNFEKTTVDSYFNDENKLSKFQNLQTRFEKKNPFKNWRSLYIAGYINKQFLKGFFTNWNIFHDYIPFLRRFLKNKNKVFKKTYKFFEYFPYLKGIRFLTGFNVILSDFVILLDYDKVALEELNKFKMPIIALVDSDMNPHDYLYKFFSNNDSVRTIKFFFKFLKEAIKEGRLHEQNLFFFYFIFKIKKTLNKNKVIKNKIDSKELDDKKYKIKKIKF